MAKAVSKGNDTAAKSAPKKAVKPAAPKTVKAAAKATKPSGKVAVAAKKTPAKRGKKTSKGDQYSCQVCGLVVSVDETCGCVDTCDIICCGEEMKARK